jgi:hypothetical protein
VIDGSELGLHHAMQAIAALLRRGLLQSTSARAAAPPAEEEVFRVTAAVSAPAEPSGPFETYRRIFRYIARELAAVRPDARSRLNSFFDRLPESRRVCFEGVRVDADGDFDVARVLANVEGGAGYPGAAARARALEALESFLAFSLFEVKNCLPRKEAELLLQEVGRMQMGRP